MYAARTRTTICLLGLIAISAFQPLSAGRRRKQTRIGASNANDLNPMQPGSTVALVTPFDKDTGNVNMGELKQLLQMHVNAGTNNLCILGTTGESNVLTPTERTLILKTAVSEVKGKMTILAGTGTIDPNDVKSMTLEAMDLGCDAALIVTPYYVKPPQRFLVNHFTTLADLGLPVVIYNVPGRTAVNVEDASTAICAQHSNIVALKDATGDLERLHSLKKLLSENQKSSDSFLLYSGDDATTMDFVLQGGNGCISVSANVAPAEMSQLMQAALQKDHVLAKSINDKLQALNSDLFCESNPIPTKYALHRMGLIGSDYCRPPLGPMDADKYGTVIDNALRQAGKI
mmetsp:Transcript_21764/g.28143  ORF Transcript_21764/g.28143 Transcript_21764/m.28143 type:complete len:345 (-) Transcript_21764:144-1178(-)